MKKISSFRFFLLFFLLLQAGCTFGSSSFEISAAGGPSWFQTNNTYVVVSPLETDSNRIKHVTNTALWKIGMGYHFFDNLLVELNAYHSSTTIHGEVWQYQLPNFNNYTFNAPLHSNLLMIDVKQRLFSFHQISLYLIGGLGAAWNNISYRETVSNATVDPQSYIALSKRTQTTVAYDLGAGVTGHITEHLNAFAEYLYTKFGTITPSAHSSTETSIQHASSFSVRSQTLLLGLSWEI